MKLSIENDRLTGFIEQLFYLPDEGPDPICLKCPGILKDQRIVGMTMMWGFEKDGIRWTSGNIMDPANGKVYASSIWMPTEDQLKVRGYWGPFFRTQTWHRLK